MKRIATITFHWATNYGAVLQSFALQKYLQMLGYDVDIIDYVPRRMKLLFGLKRIRNLNISEAKKEWEIDKFRKKELTLSPRYSSFASLSKCADKYDAIICGSDQIWNQGFTLSGEGGITLSYFLGFAEKKTRRIAYAVSFGTDHVSDEYINCVANEIDHFYAISVREETGLGIVQQFGVDAKLVCDPTLLLNRSVYEKLIEDKHYDASPVFAYVLHKNQKLAMDAIVRAKNKYNDASMDTTQDYGINEWLYRIAHAKLVITNSYHGMLFSLIFNVPFVVIPVENSGMNNRIRTVLHALGLTNRILSSIDDIDNLCADSFDWENVNRNLASMRRSGVAFLDDALMDAKEVL